MQKNCLFIVFSLLFAYCYCQGLSSFGGLWTDDLVDNGYGGNFSICVDGNNAWGLYSEFGIAIGTISEDGLTWTGDSFEGGKRSCQEGPFYLNLVENGTRLEGKFGCRDTPVFAWNARRINSEVQSDHDCGKVIALTSTNNILDGRWWKQTNGKSSHVDFCTKSDNTYQTSYTNPTFTPEGYDEGTWYTSRKIATGTFYRANNNGALPGSSLWFINPNGDLVNIWWLGETHDLNILQINNTNIHGYDVYEYSRGTTSGSCSRFSALASEQFDYYPYEDELFYFSSYERLYPDFTISQTSLLDYNSTFVNSTEINNSSDASVIAYSFAVLLITLLFC